MYRFWITFILPDSLFGPREGRGRFIGFILTFRGSTLGSVRWRIGVRQLGQQWGSCLSLVENVSGGAAVA